MKRTFFTLVLLFTVMQWSFGQSNARDVIYLKNGSIIKGSITELVPETTVKIQTPDGSLFVYEMSDVEKITKELNSSRRNTSGNASYAYYDDFSEKYRSRGYKGFVDVGYTIKIGDYSANRAEILTSHGYQFNPYLFLGGGTGVQIYHESYEYYGYYDYYSTSSTEVFMPIFADFRANFTKEGPVIPFAGIKAGYAFWLSDGFSDLGFYFAPSVGVKYMLNHRLGINLSLGYTVQLVEMWDRYGTYTENAGGFSFKFGLEF